MNERKDAVPLYPAPPNQEQPSHAEALPVAWMLEVDNLDGVIVKNFSADVAEINRWHATYKGRLTPLYAAPDTIRQAGRGPT